MISAWFGLASALGLGTADFMARFSARALGATLTYAVVLLIGAMATTIWVLATDAELVWSGYGCGVAVAHGISVSVMAFSFTRAWREALSPSSRPSSQPIQFLCWP